MGTLNLDAALIPGRGNVLIKDIPTTSTTFTVPTYAQLLAYAADYSKPPTGWVTIGHTDPEDLPEWDSDGGDSEMKRTWEMENAREVSEPQTDWFVAKPLQYDNEVLSLYLGGGDSSKPNTFTAPAARGRIEKSALIVWIDGGNVLGECLERTSVRGDGPRENAIDDWSKIPLRFTRLSSPSGGSGYHFIGEHLGTPSGA